MRSKNGTAMLPVWKTNWVNILVAAETRAKALELMLARSFFNPQIQRLNKVAATGKPRIIFTHVRTNEEE